MLVGYRRTKPRRPTPSMLDEIASAEEQEAWLALQDYEGVTALGPAREPIGRQYGFELSPNPLVEPVNGVSQAAGEQRNVEDVRADSLFFRSEKIEEQSRHALFVERFGDDSVALTEAARAASVREGYERRRTGRDAQGSDKPKRRNCHFAGFYPARLLHFLGAIRRRLSNLPNERLGADRHVRIDPPQRTLAVTKRFHPFDLHQPK